MASDSREDVKNGDVAETGREAATAQSVACDLRNIADELCRVRSQHCRCRRQHACRQQPQRRAETTIFHYFPSLVRVQRRMRARYYISLNICRLFIDSARIACAAGWLKRSSVRLSHPSTAAAGLLLSAPGAAVNPPHAAVSCASSVVQFVVMDACKLIWPTWCTRN